MGEFIVYALFAVLLVGLTAFGAVRAALRGRPPGRWIVFGAGAWFLAVVFMTVRPGSGLGARLNLIPVMVDGPASAFDAFLNFFVFVPLGILLAAVGWRMLAVLGAGLAVSLAIEVAQYFTDWGRTADVNDLITNVAGAGVGWLAAWAIRRTSGAPTAAAARVDP